MNTGPSNAAQHPSEAQGSPSSGGTFASLGDPYRHAHLDWVPPDDLLTHAEGFMKAGDFVVNGAMSDPGHPDRLFHPAAYLYRHALELALKGVIRAGRILVGDEDHNQTQTTHSLRKLWDIAKKTILQIWPGQDDPYLVELEQVVLEFHDADRTGQSFRYATDRRGAKHLDQLPRTVNLERMMERCGLAFERLDGIESGYRELFDQKCEYQHSRWLKRSEPGKVNSVPATVGRRSQISKERG